MTNYNQGVYGEHCEVVSDSQFDGKLRDIVNHVDALKTDEMPGGNPFWPGNLSVDEATQAIKQLIASELGAIIDANTDENGTDSDRVWEVLMEWMGELQGEQYGAE